MTGITPDMLREVADRISNMTNPSTCAFICMEARALFGYKVENALFNHFRNSGYLDRPYGGQNYHTLFMDNIATANEQSSKEVRMLLLCFMADAMESGDLTI
jgi:hypothetical protein